MCPPFGSDETIMAYVMPLGWGHPPHQFTPESIQSPDDERIATLEVRYGGIESWSTERPPRNSVICEYLAALCTLQGDGLQIEVLILR